MVACLIQDIVVDICYAHATHDLGLTAYMEKLFHLQSCNLKVHVYFGQFVFENFGICNCLVPNYVTVLIITFQRWCFSTFSGFLK